MTPANKKPTLTLAKPTRSQPSSDSSSSTKEASTSSAKKNRSDKPLRNQSKAKAGGQYAQKAKTRNKASGKSSSQRKAGAGQRKPQHGQKSVVKAGLHPRNQHTGRYDFQALALALPELKAFIKKSPVGEDTIDFSDAVAVKLLNKALLAHHYGVKHWDIPQGYLCPPIPGRADYVHRVADLLNSDNEEQPYQHNRVRALDVGIGANCIYPIIGVTEYGWRCTGSDVDPISVKTANFIAESNANLKGKIRSRLQTNSDHIFKGVIKENESYDVTLCNPPFHSSQEEADQGSQRKLDNLAANRAKKAGVKAQPQTRSSKPALNFGGQKTELWCPGGEAAFVQKMAQESKEFASQVLWFTTLISKKENVAVLRHCLDKQQVKQIRVVEMSQGQKVSRFVAWSFMNIEERQEWASLKK